MQDKILLGEDSEHGEFYAEKMKKYIKCSGSGKHAYIYVWNKKSLIWEESEDGICETKITKFLKQEIESRIEVLTQENNNADLLKAMTKQRKKIIQVPYAAKVWKYAKSLLVDKDFRALLNREEHTLPIQDGKIVDLKTGGIRDRTRKDLFSIVCPVNLLEVDHKLKHAKKFLMSICGQNQELFDYTVKYLGYCLTGSIADQGFMQFYGDGSNGKSVLIRLLGKILNDFMITMSPDVLVKKGSASAGAASSHLMALEFPRVAVHNETEEGNVINAGRVKEISGGDKMSARRLQKDETNFRTQAKLIVVTNKLLRGIDTTDRAMMRRVRYWTTKTRFVKKTNEELAENEQYADEEFCKKMETKYLDELFTLLVRKGSVEWYANPVFEFPEIVVDGLNEYTKDLDDTAGFISEMFDVKKDARVERAIFNKKYNEYCKDQGLKPKNSKSLSNYMKKKYGEPKKIKGTWYYCGLSLKN